MSSGTGADKAPEAEWPPSQDPSLHIKLFQEHPDGVVLTVEEKIALINPRFEELSGYRVEEVFGRPPTEVVLPKGVKTASQRATEILLEASRAGLLFDLLRKDGTVTPVDVRSRPIDVAGEPAVLSVVRDLVRPVDTEPAGVDGERTSRAVLEALPDMVFRLSRDGTYLDFAAGMEERPFLPPEEFIGKSVRDVLPSIADDLLDAIERTLSGEGTQTISYTVEYDDGVHNRETRISACGPDEVVAIARNVTAVVQLVDELRESERRFSTAFYDNPVAVSITRTSDRSFVDVNQAFLDLFGFQRDEVVDKTSVELQMIREDFPDEATGISLVRQGIRNEPVRYRAKSGEPRDVLVTVRQISTGDETCFLSTMIDVSEIARLGAELEAANEELEGRVARQLVRGNPYKLTFREFTVLNLLAEGKADKEIAFDLSISPFTVHRHVSNILGKMDCSSRTEAGTRALREGLLE